MKIIKTIKLDLDYSEISTLTKMYQILNNLSFDDEKAIDLELSDGMTITDLKYALLDLYELAGNDANDLM